MTQNTFQVELTRILFKKLCTLRNININRYTPIIKDQKLYYKASLTAEEAEELGIQADIQKTINFEAPVLEEVNEEVDIDLSKEDKKYVKKICNNPNLLEEDKIHYISRTLNVSVEEVKEVVASLGHSLFSSAFAMAKNKTLASKKRYIITSAQTASLVNVSFLENIKAYAKFIDAEIGIIATRYKNPTSIWKEEGDVWADEVMPYLTAKRQMLHPKLQMVADLKIQATSLYPLNGLDNFAKDFSCIVGSPAIAFRSVPTPKFGEKKFLMSTGSVTFPNFTDTVAGGKAEQVHSFGFVIVEIEDEEVVHFRNVYAKDDGSFTDLVFEVDHQHVSIVNVPTMVWGDLHVAKKDEEVTKAFRLMSKTLGIENHILHDVWDSCSLNVHNTKDPITQHKLMKSGNDDLQKEIDDAIEELRWFHETSENTIVVRSNHDDMLDRAMSQGDWRDNLKNAVTFVKLLYHTLNGDAPKGLFPFLIKDLDNINALGIDESYMLHGVELGMHGHKGANGAKGSINYFSKLPIPNIVGHSHSPGIRGNCMQVGIACKDDHDYNQGDSGWAYASAIVHEMGTRQLIVLNQYTLTYTTLL